MTTSGQVTLVGLFDMQVCVPKGWTDDAIETFANTERPSGVSPWRVRDPLPRECGAVDPRYVTCANDPERMHVMLSC